MLCLRIIERVRGDRIFLEAGTVHTPAYAATCWRRESGACLTEVPCYCLSRGVGAQVPGAR